MHSVPKKILILRLSSIGDIVLSTPLIRNLRKTFPELQVDFVVKPQYAELVRFNPYLSGIIEVDPTAGLRGLTEVRRRIRSERYDLVMDLHGNFRSVYLRSFCGANQVLKVDKRKFDRWKLVRFKRKFSTGVLSLADRYLEPLAEFGVRNDGEGLELFVPESVMRDVWIKMNEHGFADSKLVIAFCPAAKHATKMWPKERYVELGRLLVDRQGARIVVFGGKEHEAYCSEIAASIQASVRTSPVVLQTRPNRGGERAAGRQTASLAGRCSVLETAAAMDYCSAVVTNDTGLMHIAAARKRPVVAIFGSTVEEFGFFPYGTKSVVVERKGLYCRPCTHIGLPKCPEAHFRCMQEISASDVSRALETLLA
ncbi:MAG: glycosyltransferase family 9 protein [Bacteroidota bacterium]